MSLTLKRVNDHIHTKYPLINVYKGETQFYIHSDNHHVGLMTAGLYSASLDIFRLSSWSLDEWMENVERVMADSFRYEDDRTPVKFEYVIEVVDGDNTIVRNKSNDYLDAQKMMMETFFSLAKRLLDAGLNSCQAVRIKCCGEVLNEMQIVVIKGKSEI